MLVVLAAAAAVATSSGSFSIPRPLPDWVDHRLDEVVRALGAPTASIDRRDLESYCPAGCDQYLRWSGTDPHRGAIEVAVSSSNVQSVSFQFSNQRLDQPPTEAALTSDGSFPTPYAIVSRTLPFIDGGAVAFQRVVIAGGRGRHRWTATMINDAGSSAVLEVDAGPEPIMGTVPLDPLVVVGRTEDEAISSLRSGDPTRVVAGDAARAICGEECDRVDEFGPFARPDLGFAPETVQFWLKSGTVVSYKRSWSGDPGYFDGYVSPFILEVPGITSAAEDSHRWTHGAVSDALYRTLEWANRGVHWKVRVLCAPIPFASEDGTIGWRPSWLTGEYRLVEVVQTAKQVGDVDADDRRSADLPGLQRLQGAQLIDVRAIGITPIALVQPKPFYPSALRIAGIQGAVVLEIVVDKLGRVATVRVIKSDPAFDQAAVDAVRQWRYQPVIINGLPIVWKSTITIRFSLH